jgi:hypothetical protein
LDDLITQVSLKNRLSFKDLEELVFSVDNTPREFRKAKTENKQEQSADSRRNFRRDQRENENDVQRQNRKRDGSNLRNERVERQKS